MMMGLIGMVGCQRNTSYTMINRTENFSSINGKCHVEYNYPLLLQGKGDTVSLALTGIRGIEEFERFIQRFSEGDSALSVHVNYEVLTEDDTLISIEYLTKMEGHALNIYHSVTIDPRNMKRYSLNDLFTGDFMGVIREHVQNYTQQNRVDMDFITFEQEAASAPKNFTITPEYLQLYIGAEGEFHGYHRLKIPLKELSLKQGSPNLPK